jgi:hypothetical protein
VLYDVRVESAIGFFAVLVTAVIAFLAWPKSNHDRPRRRREPDVEGPPHPYRRPAAGRREPLRVTGWTVDVQWSRHERRALSAIEKGAIERRFFIGEVAVYPITLLEVGVRVGRAADAISIVELLYARSPDPDLAYALAKATALIGELAASESWLSEAGALGFRDVGRLLHELAFRPLHARSEWREIVARIGG